MWLHLIAGLIAAYIVAVVAVNRLATLRSNDLRAERLSNGRDAGDLLSLATWNLGYGGLGEESDFVADGGQRYLAPSRAVVEKNFRGIEKTLSDLDVDLCLLQELTKCSPLTFGRGLQKHLPQQFGRLASIYSPDLSTRLVPRPLRIEQGFGIFSQVKIAQVHRHPLTLEDEFYGGVLRRHYHALVTRVPIQGSSQKWTIINVHLAVFDNSASVRQEQFCEVMDLAAEEYRNGARVVLGGDWNMELAPSPWPHNTDERHLFWCHDFPWEQLPEGWRVGFDRTVPTARTLYDRYRENENYTAIIDGFVLSPNVEIVSVKAMDLGFRHTDHHPVVIQVRARDAAW